MRLNNDQYADLWATVKTLQTKQLQSLVEKAAKELMERKGKAEAAKEGGDGSN